MFVGGGRDDDEGSNPLVMIAILVVGWIAALMIQMTISRSREYLADETGARIAGRPDGLANALLKLEQGAKMLPSEAQPATAHMFIVNPLSGRGAMGLLSKAFSTHPPIPERVARLKAMEGHVRSL